jgi:hypothetical protein
LRRIDDLLFAFNARAEREAWPVRCDRELSFIAKKLTGALGVWRETAGDRAWPARADITARGMKNFLADMAIIEIVKALGGNRYRSPLTGTGLEHLFGRAGGQFLDEVVPQPFRDRWIAALDLASAAGCPLRTIGRLEFREQDYLQVESLMAPIGPPGESPHAILLVADVRALSDAVAQMLPASMMFQRGDSGDTARG